jgi:hypothetical protein
MSEINRADSQLSDCPQSVDPHREQQFGLIAPTRKRDRKKHRRRGRPKGKKGRPARKLTSLVNLKTILTNTPAVNPEEHS